MTYRRGIGLSRLRCAFHFGSNDLNETDNLFFAFIVSRFRVDKCDYSFTQNHMYIPNVDLDIQQLALYAWIKEVPFFVLVRQFWVVPPDLGNN